MLKCLIFVFVAFGSALSHGTASRPAPPRPAPARSAARLIAAPDGDGRFEGAIAQFAPRRELSKVRGERTKVQSALASAINDEDYVTAALLRDDLARLPA